MQGLEIALNLNEEETDKMLERIVNNLDNEELDQVDRSVLEITTDKLDKIINCLDIIALENMLKYELQLAKDKEIQDIEDIEEISGMLEKLDTLVQIKLIRYDYEMEQ